MTYEYVEQLVSYLRKFQYKFLVYDELDEDGYFSRYLDNDLLIKTIKEFNASRTIDN